MSKSLNDKLKALVDANVNNPKKVAETLAKLNEDYVTYPIMQLAKLLTSL